MHEVDFKVCMVLLIIINNTIHTLKYDLIMDSYNPENSPIHAL